MSKVEVEGTIQGILRRSDDVRSAAERLIASGDPKAAEAIEVIEVSMVGMRKTLDEWAADYLNEDDE